MTQTQAEKCHELVIEIFRAIPRGKQRLHLGALNEVLLFLEKTQREQEVKKAEVGA